MDKPESSLLNHFVAAAVAWGECQEAHEFERADVLIKDIELAYLAFRDTNPSAIKAMQRLMRTHPNPWVQYCAAASVGKVAPLEALPILDELAKQDGMWALCSALVASQLREPKH